MWVGIDARMSTASFKQLICAWMHPYPARLTREIAEKAPILAKERREKELIAKSYDKVRVGGLRYRPCALAFLCRLGAPYLLLETRTRGCRWWPNWTSSPRT